MNIFLGATDKNLSSVKLYVNGTLKATISYSESATIIASAGDTIEVTAVAKSGYRFSYWKIYEQSLSANPTTETDNPYTCKAKYDIWFYPYTEEDLTWTRIIDDSEMTDISGNTTSSYFSLNALEIYRIKVTFTNDYVSPISFSIKNVSRDCYYWVTTTTGFDSEQGIPNGETLSSAETKNTIYIYDTKTRYVWVRAQSTSKTLKFQLAVGAPDRKLGGRR